MEDKEKALATFIGKKVREYRKNKGYSQKELGKRIGKSDNTISNYETGTIKPSQDALFALAHALDIRVDDLFPPRGESTDSLHQVLGISDENFSLDDLQFLKNLMDHIKTLDEEKRQQLLSNINLTVNLFNNSGK